MKIYLFLNQSYPKGFALTKRFHLYAKGFIDNGHSAKILVPIATEKEEKVLNSLTQGVYESVPFIYTSNVVKRSKILLIRKYFDFKGYFLSGLVCIKNKPDVLILSSFNTMFYVFIWIIAYFFSIKLIKEKNEIDYKRKDDVSLLMRWKVKKSYIFFDGIIVISLPLFEYLTKDLKVKSKIMIVPVIVEDFKKDIIIPVIQKTVVYTGTYQERKDGIITILIAFSRFVKINPDFKLLLTGNPKSSKDYDVILKTIKKNKISDNVVFTGYLEEEDLINVLLSSSLLILIKPNNRQNIYNFPTKIGEYLIAGRPIISTKVGIVGDILTDKENIIFTKKDSKIIAEHMNFLASNHKIANYIGENGRNYALQNLHYMIHSKRLIDFFSKIVK